MAQFSHDLKLEVLDHITAPSDLRALCLVSKAWKIAAAPRLFAHLRLKVHERPAVYNLIQAGARGAPVYAAKTLDLTYAPQSDRLDLDFDAQIFSLAERDRVVEVILDCLPEDRLEMFRFITDGNEKHVVNYQWVIKLLATQKRLKHLNVHIPRTDPPPHQYVDVTEAAEALRLETITMCSNNHEGQHWFLRCLLKASPNVRRLCLGGTTRSISHAFDVMTNNLLVAERLPIQTIEELVLQNASFDHNAFTSINKIIDMTCLKRLIFWQCIEEPTEFLHSLVAAMQNAHSPLEHFALDTSRSGQHSYVRPPVTELYEVFPRLKSLHLGEYGAGSMILLTLATCMGVLGKTLEVLSLHDHCLAEPLGLEEFSALCSGVPLLKQLGVQIEACWLDVSPKARKYIAMLTSLRNLQTLHLRHPFVHWRNSDHRPCCSPQKLANFMFRRLHQLRVLVLSQQHFVGSGSGRARYQLRTVMYVKEYMGKVGRPTARSVTLEWLQHNETELDIMDYDPLREWRGGWPGWGRQ